MRLVHCNHGGTSKEVFQTFLSALYPKFKASGHKASCHAYVYYRQTYVYQMMVNAHCKKNCVGPFNVKFLSAVSVTFELGIKFAGRNETLSSSIAALITSLTIKLHIFLDKLCPLSEYDLQRKARFMNRQQTRLL